MNPLTPSRLSLARLPTPLQLMPRLSRELGGPRIWVKRDDLTGAALTGNKIRKLEYLVADARRQNADILITSGGVQSNHCRATALAAAQLGLRAHLILRGAKPAVPDANLLLDYLCGASTAFYPATEYHGGLADLFRRWEDEFQRQGLVPYSIPTGGSNAVGIWGYIDAARELHQQFLEHELSPQYVVCATGSGGTQAGLSLGFARLRPDVSVLGIAVCDDKEYFRGKIAGDMESWSRRYQPHAPRPEVNIMIEDAYIGPGYGLVQPEVFNTIRWAARTEGLVLDPVYTGKAFHGLVQEIKHGCLQHADDVVFVHTGGVFGLFPYREDIINAQTWAEDQTHG